jgi:hypothetical protein
MNLRHWKLACPIPLIKVTRLKAGKPLLTWPTTLGLVVLLVSLSVGVIRLTPHSESPAKSQTEKLIAHLGACYYLQAEAMAKRLYPQQAEWCNFLTYKGTVCRPIGRDVWYAKGMAQALNPPGEIPWEMWFVPDSPMPLSANIAGVKSGNLQAALRLAGYSDSNEGTLHDGNEQ